MTEDLKRRVRRRARNRCEYRRILQSAVSSRLQIEHVVAVQHGGGDDLLNLALACAHGNLHKGPNIAGRDPLTGGLTRLFHPRRDRWKDHFAWQDARLAGLSPVDRTTRHVLALNDPIMIESREALIAEGRFPSP